MRRFLINLFSLLLLTACGQKGPLYLPQEALPAPTEIKRAAADAVNAETSSETASETSADAEDNPPADKDDADPVTE